MHYTVSTLAEFACVREEIKDELTSLDRDHGNRLFIAVNEAVNNALVHGTQGKSTRHVQVVIAREEEWLAIIIRHDGTGIRRRKPGDSPEGLWMEKGRGLSIIRHFTDSAEYNARGNELILRKRLDPMACGAALPKNDEGA